MRKKIITTILILLGIQTILGQTREQQRRADAYYQNQQARNSSSSLGEDFTSGFIDVLIDVTLNRKNKKNSSQRMKVRNDDLPNDYKVVKSNGKEGVISKNGKIIIPSIYEYISYDSSYNLYWVRKNNKLGLIDNNGKIIIQPKYRYINIDSKRQGYYYVGINKKERRKKKNRVKTSVTKWGLVKNNGTVILPVEYEGISYSPKLGVYLVSIGYQYKIGYGGYGVGYRKGIIDDNGKIIIPVEYESISYISNLDSYKVSKIKKDDKYRKNYDVGVINKDGKIIIPIKYDKIESHSKIGVYTFGVVEDIIYGNSGVKKIFKEGMIDINGEIIAQAKYDKLEQKYNFFIASIGSKVGIISKSGKLVLPVKYDDINILKVKEKKGVLKNIYFEVMINNKKVKIKKSTDKNGDF